LEKVNQEEEQFEVAFAANRGKTEARTRVANPDEESDAMEGLSDQVDSEEEDELAQNRENALATKQGRKPKKLKPKSKSAKRGKYEQGEADESTGMEIDQEEQAGQD
jgi:hypothetical protein